MSDKKTDLGARSIKDDFDRFAALDQDPVFAMAMDELSFTNVNTITNVNTMTNSNVMIPVGEMNRTFDNNGTYDNNATYDNVATDKNEVAKTSVVSDGRTTRVVHHIGGFSRPG